MSSSSSLTTSEDQLITLFTSFNLSESKAKETIKNGVLSKRLERIANEAIKNGYSLEKNGKLFYHLASKMKSPQHDKQVSLLVGYIGEHKLNTVQRIDVALQYLLSDFNEIIDTNELERICGVGVNVSKEDIRRCVKETAEKYKNRSSNVIKNVRVELIREVNEQLKWADGKTIVEEILDFLKNDRWYSTENDNITSNVDNVIVSNESRRKQKNSKTKKTEDSREKLEEEEEEVNILDVMKKLNFHKPGENYRTDGYVITDNTEKLLKAHLAATKGKIRTRFPPEPNGILHIGHAKAININFGYAVANNGICFLRYDDTNPEKEEEQFFVAIGRMVEWLGYQPYKVTHSSDYFDRLYQLAVQLIGKGLAYVCHQKQDELKGFNPAPSPWRDRSIEENLVLFECMKNGLYDEGEATLRMKVTLEEGKQDPVAYRIKYLPHHRTGQKWCVYPTYDYTHCLCDSIENITHSLCTKEFQSRRSTYYWLCNALDLYCPVQWEYGRLNMNYTVVSKRKIARLIRDGVVDDWDDPRLYTLPALKRRGFPPEAINRFCAKIGVTGAQSVVDPQMLESDVRYALNETAPRTMVVIEPVKAKIVNFSHLTLPDTIEVPDYPNDPSRGTHKVQLNEIIYIEKSDFQSSSDSNFRRLTRDQTVGLRYAGVIIRVKVVEYDNREQVSTLLVTAEKVTLMNKPRAFVHWVSNPIRVQLRMYDRLFLHKDPEQIKDGYLSDVNPNSLVVYNGYADRYLTVDRRSIFQFERTGFFCKDPDSTKNLPVFNRTVTLKEDANK